MAKMLALEFADGNSIQIEGSEADDSSAERGLDDVVERVTKPFEASIDTVRAIADGLQASLRQTVTPPDSVTVHFGINFKVEGGVILTKGSAGANLDITMVWTKGRIG